MTVPGAYFSDPGRSVAPAVRVEVPEVTTTETVTIS